MLARPTFVSADPALFNPQSGRLGASRIASEIQLSVSTIAEAIGKKAPTAPLTRVSQGRQRRV